MTELYTSYERWKAWDEPFSVSRDEAAYFAGETRDLRIEGANVFEIGFGSGSFLAWARARGATITGSEINETCIAAAEQFGVEIVRPDFEKVAAVHAGRFDIIAAFDVFEHFDLLEIQTRLEASEMMLRDGGHLLLRFPNAQSPFGLAPQYGDPTHRTALSRSVFELLIQGRRFAISRYGPSYRIGGGGIARSVVRRGRYLMRDILGSLLNAVYATDIPYDPVVVIVLQKHTAR